MKRTICICGGGALGHVIAGFLSGKGFKVNLLTSRPQEWNSQIVIHTIDNKKIVGKFEKISHLSENVIPNADIILLCLPGYLISATLRKIKNDISPKAVIGSVISSTGFFIMAQKILGKANVHFGFQRVPFIARVENYGKSALLLGYKQHLNIGIQNMPSLQAQKEFALSLQEAFDTPVSILDNVLECTLTNSNPILHPSRLYALFSDWNEGKIYKERKFFYKDWDINSSNILINCDNEFQSMISKLPINMKAIPPLLEYYESVDAESLMNKIRSIKAFQTIKAPYKEKEGGVIPDFADRYFTEDIPYGLVLIRYIASLLDVATPHIDQIITWAQSFMQLDLMNGNQLNGGDIPKVECIDECAIKDLLNTM